MFYLYIFLWWEWRIIRPFYCLGSWWRWCPRCWCRGRCSTWLRRCIHPNGSCQDKWLCLLSQNKSKVLLKTCKIGINYQKSERKNGRGIVSAFHVACRGIFKLVSYLLLPLRVFKRNPTDNHNLFILYVLLTLLNIYSWINTSRAAQ